MYKTIDLISNPSTGSTDFVDFLRDVSRRDGVNSIPILSYIEKGTGIPKVRYASCLSELAFSLNCNPEDLRNKELLTDAGIVPLELFEFRGRSLVKFSD